MMEGAQVWKGVNSYITDIFLNAGLVKRGEAGTIEEKQEEQNNKALHAFKKTEKEKNPTFKSLG